MTIKPIRNDADLKAAFARLEVIFQAPEESAEADEMEILARMFHKIAASPSTRAQD